MQLLCYQSFFTSGKSLPPLPQLYIFFSPPSKKKQKNKHPLIFSLFFPPRLSPQVKILSQYKKNKKNKTKNKALYLQQLHIKLLLFMYTGALRLSKVRMAGCLCNGLQSRDGSCVRFAGGTQNKNGYGELIVTFQGWEEDYRLGLGQWKVFMAFNLKEYHEIYCFVIFFSLSEQWWRSKDFFVNVLEFLQIVAITKKLVVFYFLECISPLIGFINIYTLSTNRNKYNKHCCRMSTFSFFKILQLICGEFLWIFRFRNLSLRLKSDFF